MKEESNLVKVMFVTAIICILLCIPLGILIGNKLLTNTGNKETNNTINSNLENNSVNEINNTNTSDNIDNSSELSHSILANYLVYYVSESNNNNNNNILDSAKDRIYLIELLLESEKQTSLTNGEIDQVQESRYVSYSTFKDRYEELFGDNYSSDVINKNYGGSFNHCEAYISVKDGNNVCWLGRGITGDKVKINNFTRNATDTSIVITGEYSRIDIDEEIIGKGQYTLEYSIDNNEEHLNKISIVTK